MKQAIYFIKEILSFTVFVLLIVLLCLKYKENRLERKIDRLKVIQIDTVYIPLPQPTIITP